MADIFTFFRKMDDKSFSMLTAALRTTTRENLGIHGLQKVANFGARTSNFITKTIGSIQIDQPKSSSARLFNCVTNLFGKARLPVPEIVEPQERANEIRNYLIGLPRAELNDIFRVELRKRVEHPEWLSDDAALSQAIITAAYSGNENFTTWQKADAVVQKHYFDFPDQMTAIQNLLSSDMTDIISVNRKCLRLCIYLARRLYGKPFTPTSEELNTWTKYKTAFLQADAEWNAYYQQRLPKKAEFLTDSEIERRVGVLSTKNKQLTNFVQQTLDDEFQHRKNFSECAEVERDEILERMPAFFNEQIYRFDVEQNNRRYQENMRPVEVMSRVTETRAISAYRPVETYTNEEMAPRIHKAIREAQTEIAIVCPWLNMKVVRQNFLEEFRTAIARGVTIKICYGITGDYRNDRDKTRAEWSDKTADMLRRELGNDKLEIIRGNTHDKFVFCDDEYYFEGGFNLLSFDGDYSKADRRREHMTLSYDKVALRRYKADYFS